MSIIESLINGIIQGLTEFLPISSSGHLALLHYFTGSNTEQGFLFTILLHLGTLLAVFIAFWRTIWEMLLELFRMIHDIFTGDFHWKGMPPMRRMIFLLIFSLLPMIGSYFFLDYFKSVETGNDIVPIGASFLITALLLAMASGRDGYKGAGEMKYRDAFVIGVAQAVAPMPGISRSGATISAGLFMGLEREHAVAFSFIMGIPTVLGANILELGSVSGEAGLPIPGLVLLTGVLSALVFGLIAIKLVSLLVVSDKLKYFAWYLLIIGVLTVGVGIFENLTGHPIQAIISELMVELPDMTASI